MAMIFKAMSGLSYDNISFNPLLDPAQFVTILSSTVTGPVNLTDYLSVDLACSQNQVLVDGVFNFSISGIALTPADSVEVDILFYRDEARTNLVYQTSNTISGITLTAAQDYQLSVPVQFQDRALLRVTEDIANYYITVNTTLNAAAIGAGVVTLDQYSVTASVVDVSQRLNCYGGF